MAALFLCTATSNLFAQESGTSAEADANWYYGKPIKNVSFKGLRNVASKDVEGVTSSFVGKRFSDDVFADMIDRIYALEFFDDVEPEALPGDPKRNTVSIVFVVTERPVVTRLLFRGNKAI